MNERIYLFSTFLLFLAKENRSFVFGRIYGAQICLRFYLHAFSSLPKDFQTVYEGEIWFRFTVTFGQKDPNFISSLATLCRYTLYSTWSRGVLNVHDKSISINSVPSLPCKHDIMNVTKCYSFMYFDFPSVVWLITNMY